jgi:hypothetical protein
MYWGVTVVMAGILWAPQVARADWQYTKWGMTPEQVLAASKGKLRRCSVDACKGQATDNTAAQFYGEYVAGEFFFTVYTMFDKRSNKLTSVNLILSDPAQGDSLVGSVRAKYGEPANQSRTAIMSLYVWRDQKDQISIIDIGRSNVSLQYQPRLNEANKGL